MSDDTSVADVTRQRLGPERLWLMTYPLCYPKLGPLSSASSPQAPEMLPHLRSFPVSEQEDQAVQQAERHHHHTIVWYVNIVLSAIMLLYVLGMLRRAFRQWCAGRDMAIVTRLKFERAVVRHSNHLMSSSLTRWRMYVALSRRKQLLRRQCIWLLGTRLVASHFLRWRAEFAARRHENTQTMSALWHWSVVLQHKVCWYLITYTA